MAHGLLANRPSSFPSPRTPLIGREREVAAVCALLCRPDVPVVTLIGAGGVGKTRLALAASAVLATSASFPGGIRFVDLAALTDPTLVLPTIAQALGVQDAGDQPLGERLAALLADNCLLLVLDNVEQVIEAVPSLAALLAACSCLTILATSRAVLHLTGEHVFPVLPLPVPIARQPLAPTAVAQHGAVALFVQRAQAADPDFTLTDENAPIVAQIVRRLDGLPLAIELAASHIRTLSPTALLARLNDRLRLLTGGARDLPGRQRTMRDTIAWSYGLLPPRDQDLFRRLGVFVGGFTLAAAEAVVAVTGQERDGFEAIASLVDASLLRKGDGPGEPRYTMLETVREYARERLVASGDLDETSRAHAAWCLALAEDVAPGLVRSAPVDAFERMPAEHDNLRAALEWATEHGEAELALSLVAELVRFWLSYGHLGEGRRWAAGALALPGDPTPPVRARALVCLGWLTAAHGEPEAGRPFVEEGLAIAQAFGDIVAEVRALGALGFIAAEAGDLDEAGSRWERRLDLFRALGDQQWELYTLSDLATVAALKGDLEAAITLFETALTIARTLGDRGLIGILSGNLAFALHTHGQTRRAAALLCEAVTTAHVLGIPYALAVALGDAAEFAATFDRSELAARLLGAGATLRLATDIPPRQIGQADDERRVAATRAALGETAFATAWAAGAALSLDAAVAEADAFLSWLAEIPEPSRPLTPDAAHGLTPRERDVLRLLVEGHSDREIAASLGIGYRTVTSYVRNILAKFGVDSRTAAATHAVRHGLG